MQGKLAKCSPAHKSAGTHGNMCRHVSPLCVQMQTARNCRSLCWATMQIEHACQSQRTQRMEAAGLWCRTASIGLTGKSCGESCGATAARALRASLVRLSDFHHAMLCWTQLFGVILESCRAVRMKTSFAVEFLWCFKYCVACSHNQQLPCSSAAIWPPATEADCTPGTPEPYPQKGCMHSLEQAREAFLWWWLSFKNLVGCVQTSTL